MDRWRYRGYYAKVPCNVCCCRAVCCCPDELRAARRNELKLGATRIETARAYMRWVSHIDAGATRHEVKCPVPVLTTQSPRRAYSRSDIDVYREKRPQAEIVALAVDGYHVRATDPDQCARVAREFLLRTTRS